MLDIMRPCSTSGRIKQEGIKTVHLFMCSRKYFRQISLGNTENSLRIIQVAFTSIS